MNDSQAHSPLKQNLLGVPIQQKSLAYSSYLTRSIIREKLSELKPGSYRTSGFWQSIMLFLQCMMVVGRYYAFDNPQALEQAIKSTFQINDFDYTLLYSVYSVPNLIVPFLGGFIIDKYGTRIGIFAFTSFVTVGQAIVWLGALTSQYWLMLAGRIVFGLGGELVEVGHQNMAFKWFPDRLGLAMGLGISFSRIGSASNSYLTPKLYDYSNNLAFPLLVSFAICVFSWLMALIVCWIDYTSDCHERLIQESKKSEENNNQQKIIDFKAIRRYEKMFWLLAAGCGLTYGIVIGFLDISNDFVSVKFNMTASEAGNIITIYYLVSMALTPVFGKATDYFGKRLHLMILSNLILLGVLASLTIFPDCNDCVIPIYIFIAMGVFMAIYGATLWPSIPLVVDISTVGTAFGIIYGIMNCGTMLLPIVIGAIKTISDYRSVTIMLIGFGVGALAIAIFLECIDSRTGNRLNRMPEVDQVESIGGFDEVGTKSVASKKSRKSKKNKETSALEKHSNTVQNTSQRSVAVENVSEEP